MTDDKYIYSYDELVKKLNEKQSVKTTDDFMRENVPPMVQTIAGIQVLSKCLNESRPKKKVRYTQKDIDKIYWRDRR